MNARRLIALAAATVVVAGAAVWVSVRSRPERAAAADRPVLTSLAEAIDAISEVRLSRGDGAATTLQRRTSGWFVAQRNYPADPGKLRSLLIGLSGLHVIEQKTSDPAHYAALNVEDATGPRARSVRIDVVAGARTWSLLLGKAAELNGSYVRVPGEAAAVLAQPHIDADAQPARWIKPELLDVAADRIEQVTVRPADGPSYRVGRDKRGADLTLHDVPPGRKPAGPAMVAAVASSLMRLNAEDVKERAATMPTHSSRAGFRTFDGLQLDLVGYRDGGTAWIRVDASVDPDAARRFAATQAAADKAKSPDQAKSPGRAEPSPDQAKATDQPKAPDAASEAAAINGRLQGFDFQIPVYQYDALYRPLKDLLASPPQRSPAPISKGPR
jgi:hypothetical protein